MFISFENPPLLNLTSLSLVAAFFAVAFPSFGLAQVFFSLFPLRIMVLNWRRRAAKPFHTGGATEKVDLINCQFVHNYFCPLRGTCTIGPPSLYHKELSAI